jgi:hypothetical protein
MEAQGKQMSEPFTLEATAALIDLVRFSRRIGSAVCVAPFLALFLREFPFPASFATPAVPCPPGRVPCLKDRGAQSGVEAW